MKYLYLNFSHASTDEQLSDLGIEASNVVHVPCNFDMTSSLQPQIVELVDSVGWVSREWETNTFIVNPPALSSAACLVIAEIHGRCGHFPTIAVIINKAGTFCVKERIPLQSVRDESRTRRFKDGIK